MIKSQKLIILSLTLFLTSCASNTVPYSSEHDNTWFLENRGGRVFPIYCMANKKENSADPKCFEADKMELKKNW